MKKLEIKYTDTLYLVLDVDMRIKLGYYKRLQKL